VAPAELARAESKIETLKKELEALRGLVHVDHLTGALNRSGLDEAYAREAARADRRDAALGVALIDVDDFKRINDNHGHQAGDAALVHFAQVIRRTIRPSDVMVRFGGEEFLFLLPDSGPEQTASALSRLQHDLGRSPLVYMEHKLPMTFSAGIAVRKTGETSDAVITRADRALYQAKGKGKNRTVTAD
jgi:diguanylate cyclase